MPKKKKLAIYVSGEALALLKELDFPCSEGVLASATPTEEGTRLTGSQDELESLARWVAGEINHADRRAKRRLALLYHVSEALEAVIDGRDASFW